MEIGFVLTHCSPYWLKEKTQEISSNIQELADLIKSKYKCDFLQLINYECEDVKLSREFINNDRFFEESFTGEIRNNLEFLKNKNVVISTGAYIGQCQNTTIHLLREVYNIENFVIPTFLSCLIDNGENLKTLKEYSKVFSTIIKMKEKEYLFDFFTEQEAIFHFEGEIIGKKKGHRSVIFRTKDNGTANIYLCNSNQSVLDVLDEMEF